MKHFLKDCADAMRHTALDAAGWVVLAVLWIAVLIAAVAAIGIGAGLAEVLYRAIVTGWGG